MNPQDVAAALKSTFTAAVSVDVFDYVPDSPNPPCLVVYPESFAYDGTQGMRWIVMCLAGTADTESGQQQLWRWLSDTDTDSLIAAIDADPTLGAQVSNVIPVEMRNWTTVVLSDGRRLLQAELVLDVLR